MGLWHPERATKMSRSIQLDGRPVWAEVSPSAILHNLRTIRRLVGRKRKILAVVKANGYFQAPRIPWQYTINASVYYDTGPYEFKLAIYNLTDQENLEGSSPFYGNDFIVHSDPIDAEFTVKATF